MSESRKPLEHWLAPEGAGRPLSGLATSFTFDIDFFEEECLSRFLGLDWKRNEGDDERAYLIEQEEKLAEARISVIVDRSSFVDGRNLRWDLMPVRVRGGVMHAKVCLLVWEHVVRCVIGSANLTPAGYRRKLEAQLVLDASDGGGVPTAVFREAIGALRQLANRASGSAREPGPKREALSTLRDAERRLTRFGERRSRRGDPRIAILAGGPRQPVLDGLDRVWRGGPAREATVLSPFFDAPGTNDAATALADRLASRGRSRVEFVVETGFPEAGSSRVPVQAPESLLDSLPDRVESGLFELSRPEGEKELRRLHAKAIHLENGDQHAILIGSSNFTRPGLGLGSQANLEINVAIGAARGSETAKGMRGLIPIGDPIDPDKAQWEPAEGEEDPDQPQLPWGFDQALLDPLPPATLTLRLEPGSLPEVWAVTDPSEGPLTDSERWEVTGRPAELKISLTGESPPFFVKVRWTAPEGERQANWPVNVTDKVALPPPEELRALPVDALLKALASTRPLHEGLTEALQAREQGHPGNNTDPLLRHDGAGQLIRRARLASQAFDGLRERLERPAASEDTLAWRLTGPFGPTAIAEGLIAKAKEGRAVQGEASFLLAELALTLSRVDWSQSGSLISNGPTVARAHARKALAQLRGLRVEAEEERLAAYVELAFEQASR